MAREELQDTDAQALFINREKKVETAKPNTTDTGMDHTEKYPSTPLN